MDRIVRGVLRRPVQVLGPGQAFVAGTAITGARLLVPVLVTTAAGAWADAPFWRWLVIAALLAAGDVSTFRHLHDTTASERFMALAAVIDRDEDMHDLVRLTRRWWRPGVLVLGALLVALAVLSACAVLAPGELGAVHVGSLALLAELLYEFGEAVIGTALLVVPLGLRQAHYLHRLPWNSPLSSPAVQTMLQAWGRAILMMGWTTALYFVLAVVLLEPDTVSVLLAPIAGFAAIALLVTVGSLVVMRSGVRSIVRRSRDRTLARLQRRIDEYEPRLEELSPTESQQLQGLLATYAAVRDTPTSPSSEQTLGRAVGALVIPALGFLLAVLAEVYAERLLDQVVP